MYKLITDLEKLLAKHQARIIANPDGTFRIVSQYGSGLKEEVELKAIYTVDGTLHYQA